jgi:predicted nucleic acid-binding protein
MTPVVIDSSVLIDAFRRHEPARRAIRAARARGELWSPVTTRIEILGGLLPGEERRIGHLLSIVAWQPITADVADIAAAYTRRYRGAFSGIDMTDYLIAATTEVLGGTLLTRNVRHFPMFPGLEPAY